MNKMMAVRKLAIGAGCALALAGCGGAERGAARPAAAVARRSSTPDPMARHGRALIVFRRVRYEGATLNVMTLFDDGFIKIDVPNGGAGGAKFVSRAKPWALGGVRRSLATTPWKHLSKRRVRFDRSGAYFMLHRRGEDYIAMADGMSPDIKPLVTRLNAILTGDGRGARRMVHRWGRI